MAAQSYIAEQIDSTENFTIYQWGQYRHAHYVVVNKHTGEQVYSGRSPLRARERMHESENARKLFTH